MSGAEALRLAAELRSAAWHNDWGLPGHHVGTRGRELLRHGPAALAALRPLLDDAAPLAIIGSEAATLHDAARWRLADLAGWLLAQQLAPDLGRQLADPSPASRDATLAALRRLAGPPTGPGAGR